MEYPQPLSPPAPASEFSFTARSRSNTKLADDVTSLTSFNPFAEEDENDQSSYALVTSLFSKVKSTLSAPLSSASASVATVTPNPTQNGTTTDLRRPSMPSSISNASLKSVPERPNPLKKATAAPPLVSLTPVVSETPSYDVEFDTPSSRGASYYPLDTPDGGVFGTAIPGFEIQDDARSIRTTVSIRRSASVSKAIRRIRGEGLSKDYWMDDELCKECYDCKSIFTAWRRKHHCRICGQVFCSRCASNIIKGARFGQNGMIRICNLCLEKLAKVDDDDDDDRRSIVSSVTSPFAAHQLGSDSFSLGHHSQSPFAASQLFGRTNEPFNLFSIAETKRSYADSEGSGFISRATSPTEDFASEDFFNMTPAPFRRALTEEEKDSASLSDNFHHDRTPTVPGVNAPIEFPITVPVSVDGSTSSVQFPTSSPDPAYGLDSPGNNRSRFNSYADFDVATPFMRSRVQSRLGDAGEPGWRTRRESTAYAQELNLISMFHLRIMLRQMLTKENIPNIKEWEETLLKLALRIARELTFTAHPHRQGADMDVRRYVKIKKIPGGAPRDSEYVDGAVITKNVAHKQMLRTQRNPRVMLVTFPLEFHRVEGQYMHFAQISRQEKEYLNNLASRIAALRPHVVLVEKSVSRLALDALTKHRIVVARTVKPSAISFVARMTQGDVFSSMDKLALEPHLGHCTHFSVQTFDHPLIPGRRKTYMRFEGCNREMGCTILLRGGDIDILTRIKKVTRFLAFIVRNLRLETHLWKDSVITLPTLTTEATPRHLSSESISMPPLSASAPFLTSQSLGGISEGSSENSTAEILMEDLPDEDAEQIRLSRRIEESLEPYRKTFISVSATLRFDPPHPIRRMKELDDELVRVKREWEDEIVRREQRAPPSHQQEETITVAATPAIFDPDDVAAQIESLVLPDIPDTSITSSILSNDRTDYFDPSSTPSNFNHVLVSSPLPTISEELPVQIKTMEDIALESRLSHVKGQHAEQRRIWEWYLRKNRDDFDVEKYQRISLWEFTLPIAEFGLHRACQAPQLKYITFYGENDCTLGQFIEKSVMDTLVQFLDPKAICENKHCNQPLARHCTVFVHNETRLFVAVEQWDGQIMNQGTLDTIITWSACRHCRSATPFIPVSEEMQRYSFAKFLELHFYPTDVKIVQGAGCHHNIYKDHIRYFAIKGMTVRFQADPVAIYEVVYPPMRIRVRPETQLNIKNTDFERLHSRNNLWYTALIDDLKLITIDAATGDEEADARLTTEINTLIHRAEWEKNDITKLINQIYTDTPATDTLALNQVRAYRQDKIVAWQQDFDRLPKPRAIQADKSGRRTSALGTVRASMFSAKKFDMYGALESSHVPSSSVSEAEETTPAMRRNTGDSFTSAYSASDAEASESESVVDSTERVSGDITVQSGIIVAHNSLLVNTAAAPPKSDPESDSTIGAGRAHTTIAEREETLPVLPDGDPDPSRSSRLVSRLPRRPSQHPSVAELVRKYQDFLPAQGVEELTKTAFPPNVPISESDQEAVISVRSRIKSKGKSHFLHKRSSISDFEQSYTANIAPKYLTHSRRPLGQMSHGSRIPGPVISLDSVAPSRRSSPDKRSSVPRMNPETSSKTGRTSPTLVTRSPFLAPKPSRGKMPSRPTMRDKVPSSRPTSTAGPKSTIRRPPTANGKVSNIAKHFERVAKDNERASRRYAVIRGRRARPVASARAKVEVLDSVKDAIKDESESSDSSEADDEGDDDDETNTNVEQTSPPSTAPQFDTEAEGSSHDAPAPVGEGAIVTDGMEDSSLNSLPVLPTSDIPAVPPSPTLSSRPPSSTTLASPIPDLDLGATGHERTSIFKAITGFWPQQTQTSRRLEEADDPMSDPEHIFRDSSMVVRTDEPTSIIALALNSPQYRDMLAKSRAEKRQQAKLRDDGEVFMPDDKSVTDSNSTWGVVNVESTEGTDPTEELRTPSSKLPWAISFVSGGLTISCTVLYPEQFDALRRTYDCERSMIESLARCVKWDTSGGKSGSAFLKTLDDRFIAKELSRAELQAMETFAPAYFDYMSSAVIANRPTLLAKIFGCFKITFKKTHKDRGPKSKITQMNLLVMENLFYDRRFSKIYDLKGSTRNRHVQSTGRENEVLLDENLVETAHLAPFYFREHSKRILRGALFNDSKFLADINVMDYSLVVGVDSQTNELVVGIVDYIRTYTWDKKLESWVKDSTFLGGANKGEPTIIGPKQYRHRFLSAMERYFPLVPDRWMKLQDTPEEEGNNLLDLWPDW